MPEQKEAAAQTAPVFSVPLPVRQERRRLEEVLVRMPHEDKEAVKRLAAEAGMSLSASHQERRRRHVPGRRRDADGVGSGTQARFSLPGGAGLSLGGAP